MDMTPLLWWGLGAVAVWRGIRAIGVLQCRRRGHQWIGTNALDEGRVKMACGRCGRLGWTTTAQWYEFAAARSDADKRLGEKFDAIPSLDPSAELSQGKRSVASEGADDT